MPAGPALLFERSNGHQLCKPTTTTTTPTACLNGTNRARRGLHAELACWLLLNCASGQGPLAVAG